MKLKVDFKFCIKCALKATAEGDDSEMQAAGNPNCENKVIFFQLLQYIAKPFI